MFKLYFFTDNAAFGEDNMATEIVAVLNKIVRKVRIGQTNGDCMDSNGNQIGVWECLASTGENRSDG